MDRALQFSQVSSARQTLIRLCQAMNYGSIQELTVRNREPILTDAPMRLLADLKLDGVDEPRPEVALSDFVLSVELVRLMFLLDRMGEGKISRIEIRAGLPRGVVVETSVSEYFGPAQTTGNKS
jgi:hypothetical protein